MKGPRATEESQRTRSFLYSSVAYAISNVFKVDSFTFFENGITSLNFPKRADMINARSSRTTHPKTIWLLQRFFEHFNNRSFEIKHPYLLFTKTDVIAKLKGYNKASYINNTVSCSVALKTEGNFTHCGTCSQCVDRRFAMYASQLDVDDGLGIYAKNFITEKIEVDTDRLTIIDHIRQAINFLHSNSNKFYTDMAMELSDLLEYMNTDEETAFNQLYTLCRKHGEQIHSAILRMRSVHDDPFSLIAKGSFLDIVKEKEYLKPDVRRLCARITDKLQTVIPIMFKNNAPKNENDLNDKINAIINGEADQYGREFPSIRFSSIRTVIDHSFASHNLLIESKFLRGNTGERVITDAIGADMIKYPKEAHLLFLLYDPERKISLDSLLKETFEAKQSNVTISIIR